MADLAPLSMGEAYCADRRHYFLGTPFDRLSKEAVLGLLDNCSSHASFRYVVTPNVDHVVRLNGTSGLAPYYDQAWLSLCDSWPISRLAGLMSLDLPLVTGSDLTAALFSSVIRDGDKITLIAANAEIVRALERAYPRVCFRVKVPPEAVCSNPAALMDCVDFAAREAARFVFIGIGSPQSEKIAYAIMTHPEGRGIGFCVGASLEFLAGAKRRAPIWMRHAGLEWLHRLASDPRRLWRRYVFAVVPLIRLFAGEIARRHHGAG